MEKNALQPSAKVNKAHQKYSTFSRELMAVYAAIKHFRHLLEGKNFVIKHRTHALHDALDNYSLQEVCQLDYISQFKSNLRHIQGPQNVVADILSRSDIQFISDSDISHEKKSLSKKDTTIHQAIYNNT